MKYFIDTEFIERFTKWTFAVNRHVIDLISIGIVAEDERELYLISSEYNYNDADEWVKKNVIEPMYIKTVSGDNRNRFRVESFHKTFGLPNKKIAEHIGSFVRRPLLEKRIYSTADISDEEEVKFYGYYADYDWVLFCSLFGRMIDLPKGFPMYCRDLKQMLDEYNEKVWLPESIKYTGDATITEKLALEKLKDLSEYPKQNNEHNALGDAKWNYELYKFILTLK